MYRTFAVTLALVAGISVAHAADDMPIKDQAQCHGIAKTLDEAYKGAQASLPVDQLAQAEASIKALHAACEGCVPGVVAVCRVWRRRGVTVVDTRISVWEALAGRAPGQTAESASARGVASGVAWVAAQVRGRPPSWSGVDREGRLVGLYCLLAVGWLAIAGNIAYGVYVDRVMGSCWGCGGPGGARGCFWWR